MKYSELKAFGMRQGCAFVRDGNHVSIYAPRGHIFAATDTILVCGQSDDFAWCDALKEDIEGGFDPICIKEWEERCDNSGKLAYCIQEAQCAS